MKVRHNICFIVILLMVSLFSFSAMQVTAYAEEVIPKATDQFYVNDFADVFSPEQEEIMQQRAVTLAEKPEGVQVVVTTVTTLSGYTVDEYATMMYNEYQIGLDSRGILILLSTGERQIRVEVGDGLRNSFYSDAKASEAIDKYALDYLKDNKFDLGLMNLQEKIVAELDEHFDIVSEDPERTPVTVQTNKAPTQTTSQESDHSNTGVVIVNILFLTGFAVIGFLYYSEKKQHQADSESYEERINSQSQELRSWDERYRKLQSSYDSIRGISDRNASSCDRYRDENSSLTRRVNTLDREFTELSDRYEVLQRKYDKLSERFERAKKLHKKLDGEIDDDIQREIDKANREAARQFDDEYGSLQNREPSSNDLTVLFESAFSAYKALTGEQKKYVQTDMARVRQIYDRILVLKEQERAKKLNGRLEKLCSSSSSGSESRLSEYRQLYSDYQMLDRSAQGFVSGALVGALTSLIADGEREQRERIAYENAIRAQQEAEERRRREERKRQEEAERRRREDERRRREEEEERRRREDRRRREEEERERRERRRREEEEEARRRRSSSSSSSFGSHHSGFGGHSSGGGASRGF